MLFWGSILNHILLVFGLVRDALDFIASQPALIALFSAGLIPIGIKIFRSSKRAVK